MISFLVVTAAGAVTVWMTFPRIERWAVGVHQKSVTRSLAAWGVEHAQITNAASARDTAGMVGYVNRYYVPGEGYRGPAEIEAALETQRQRTIGLLVAALERYTGLAYGTNVERWRVWAEESQESGTNGPANVDLPVSRRPFNQE